MHRSRPGRGLAILAIAALAVAVVSPAFSAGTLTKAKVKKIATKVVKKLAPTLEVASADALSSQKALTYQASVGTSAQVIYDNGNLKLTATCAAGPALTLAANTAVNNATINSYGNGSDTGADIWDTGETKTLSDGDEWRGVVYTTPDGQIIVIQYAAAEGTIYGGPGPGCIVKGLVQVL